MALTFNATRRASYFGYITQGIINNLSPVLFIIFRTEFGLSYERLGSLILINFVTQLFVDLLSVRFIDGLGYRIPIVAAHAFSSVGLVLLGILPSLMRNAYVGLVIATMVSAIGGGLLEVLVSPIVDSLPAPKGQKSSAMSLLHSFYCWGQVLVVLATTVILSAIGGSLWNLIPFIWALIPFANMFIFMKVPLPETVTEENRTKLSELFRTPAFLAILVLMLCSGASELTISQWSSLFAEQGLGLSKVMGDIAGPCMFAVLMGIGRTIYGIWGAKIKLMPFMTGSAALCVLCYLLTALSGNPVLSLIGCAVSGFSVSIMWPGTFSIAARRFPFGSTAMFALLAMAGDMGCSFGPWLAGIIADNASGGLKAGILGGIVFPALMVLIFAAFLLASKQAAPQNAE